MNPISNKAIGILLKRFGPQITKAIRTYGKTAAKRTDDLLVKGGQKVGHWGAGGFTFSAADDIAPYLTEAGFTNIGGGRFVSPWAGRNAAVRLAQRSAWKYLYPANRRQAFMSGFTSGTLRTSGAIGTGLAADFLLALPKAFARYPQTKAFLRVGINTYRGGLGIQNIPDVSRLSKVVYSIKQAKKAATSEAKVLRTATGIMDGHPVVLEGLYKYEVAGSITGRLGTASGAYYLLTDEDERKRRINKFKKTFKQDTKKISKTYVQGYVKKNGQKVQGHYRSI